MNKLPRFPLGVTPRCPICVEVLFPYEGQLYCLDCDRWEPTAETDEEESVNEQPD